MSIPHVNELIEECKSDIIELYKQTEAYETSLEELERFWKNNPLNSTEKITAKSYEHFVKVHVQHFIPKKSIVAERCKFYKRFQKEGETLAEYAKAIKELASTCEFKLFLEDAVRDRFVCGIRDQEIQQRLMTEGDKNFYELYLLAARLKEEAKVNIEHYHSQETNVVPYNYCQPPILQQNIVPPPCPVYQPPPIIVPIPAPPRDCESACTTVKQSSSDPGRHEHGHPHGPPHPHPHLHPHPHSGPGHPSIPGLSDADAKQLVPNLGSVGHHHPVVVQSVIVGKKEKEEKESEEEKGEKDQGEKEECKKKRPKKKCASEEVEDDDQEETCRPKRKRRRRRRQRRPHHLMPYEPYYPLDMEPVYDPCAECNAGNQPLIMYYSK